jgi:septum site-determining protein MinC
MTKVLTDARSIRIKGRSFLAVVLSPDLPLDQWLERLDDLAARSAGFFLDRPVVLDVSELSIKKAELKQLIDDLAARKVRIMGIEGARPSQLTPEMPPAMKGGKPASDVEVTAQEPETEAEAEAEADVAAVVSPAPQRHEAPQVRAIPQSLTIDEPVRSGQSIIFPEGDITIVGSVASGAEVIAGGSIHIYGTLRGRAMAGSIGNSNARIFCRRLEAELIAIDGIYKMAEDMDSSLRGHAVQLSLEGETIMADVLF